MSRQRFETGKMPQITLEACHGDLVVRSWMESAVLVQGDAFDANHEDSSLSLISQGGLKMMVPSGAALAIETVHGDCILKNIDGDISLTHVVGDTVLTGLNHVKVAAIDSDLSAKNIDGLLSISTVNGDAALRNVGGVILQTINGDLSAGYINGNIQVNQASGDISLNTINGDVTIAHGNRDLNLRNLGGVNTVSQIDGDIRLIGGLGSGEHTFRANGDILVRWPVDEPINLVAQAPKINNRLPMDNFSQQGDTLTGNIGDGKTHVTLGANGRIYLKEAKLVKAKWENLDSNEFHFDFNLDLAGLSEHINSEIMQQVSRLTNDLEINFGPDFAENLSQSISHKAERAAAKAEKALNKLEREMERINRRHGGHRAPKPPTPPPPPKAKPQASREEQIQILKMVENGTITPDEAATLLKALEG